MARSPAASQSDASAKTSKRAKPKKRKARKRPRCKGKTQAGKRCTNPAKKGSTYCGSHSGKSGQPTKFTPETQAKILQGTQLANFKTTVCKGAGITEVSLATWLDQGKADIDAGAETEFSEFFRAYTQAEAEGEERLVAHLQAAAQKGSVRALLELLKRRYRERWGDNVKVEAEVTGAGGAPLNSSIDPEKLTVDQRIELAALLRQATPDPPEKGTPQ